MIYCFHHKKLYLNDIVKEFSEKAINEEAADEILNVIDAVVGVMMMIHKYVLNLNE